MAIERIQLNLIPTGEMPVCHAKQYDKGREIGIDLLYGLKPYYLADEALELDVRKSDNHLVTIDVPYTEGTSSVVFATTEQMCAVSGSNICALKVTKGGVVIGSLNFVMEVEKSVLEGGLPSESDIENLETQMRAIAEPMVEEIAPPIVEELVPQVIGDDYYTKAQTNLAIATAIEGKADTTYVNEELSKKADKTDTYTKTEVNTRFNNKMDKANPTGTGSMSVGSEITMFGYNSQAFGSNHVVGGNDNFIAGVGHSVAYGSNRFVFGSYCNGNVSYDTIEIVGNGTSGSNRSNARTLDKNGNMLIAGDLTFNGNKSLNSEISRLDGRIDTKANASDVYDKSYINTALSGKADANNVYLKSETDNLLNGKADVSDLPDMSQYYDKNEVDTALGTKADQNDFSSLANVVSGLSDDVEALEQNKADKSDTYTKAQVDDIVYGILPDDTASGSVANFNTSLELPIKSLEVDVNAVQSAGTPTPASPLPMSGWSQIKVYQRGINLWNENTEIGGLDDTTGQPTSDNNRLRSADYCPIKENETVYVKKGGLGNINLFFYDASKTFLSKTGWVSGNATRNIPSGAYYFKIVLATQYGTTYNHDISINYPSSDTEYHAYNPNGTTEVINLGGTYYGGHFTQDKDGHRQFEVTHDIKLFGDISFSRSNNGGVWDAYLFYAQITDKPNGGVLKCSNYDYVVQAIASMQNEKIVAVSTNKYIYIRDDAYTTVADFKTANANTQLVYPLATPYTIDLPDGQPIITLNGTNNIYAETGDTEVVFKCSVNDYVSAHSGGNLLGMGGVYLGGAKSGGGEEETDESEEPKKEELKEEIKTIGDDNTKKLGGEE